ncbi:LysR family transcriptional regulator [Psychrobacter phenylpyruvicus]|uniref:HTH-type transcriptional regulator gltC n=1 Tax=Psychrobacter phenylpyruvicus TaxID=29432 RepID=A0A379LKD3_9GAMM|nr:LysR family transcriptional regulator [Psychrobacter phenylpyruvicus]SUD91013.1 HTH-type transcriptional regulator gltC [Psychrobacter phenylpyruvicus]
MDWDDLSYFILLVQQQTLTACAEKLDVQHSTVSRRIARLEKSLSLKLFNRLGKRYSLTQEGEQLYVQAIEIQKEMLTFERMAINQNTMQGKVVVSAPPVLANELLIKALPAFRQQYPDIVIHLRGDLHIRTCIGKKLILPYACNALLKKTY